uniref:Uncharacterized protein n=1 Tax=Anguilla anguilla TaxID=7936 RepID=A0A0E9RKG1_ANGAN
MWYAGHGVIGHMTVAVHTEDLN